MPLIIETYFDPFTKISRVLFPNKTFERINSAKGDIVDEERFCYVRKHESHKIKYYFNKIYYLEKEKIVCLHKSARMIKYYDLETGKLIHFESPLKDENKIDKTAFLPQIEAQNGEIVLFPEEDSDE